MSQTDGDTSEHIIVDSGADGVDVSFDGTSASVTFDSTSAAPLRTTVYVQGRDDYIEDGNMTSLLNISSAWVTVGRVR